MPINTSISVSTFQQCDGTNFTTAGVDNNIKVGNGNLGVYSGIGLTFDGKPSSAIIDLKGSMPYGNSCVSGGFRIRNNSNENSQTVQFRVQPATVTIPISNKIGIYTTPYGAAKLNCKTGKIDTSIGNYTGIYAIVEIGGRQVKGSIDLQAYDLTKINRETISFNAGVSITV